MGLLTEKLSYDVVVVGGGMSGLCAALSSARHGAKTALIQNRPVLGGNASSEIRMHICGADHHGNRPEARETGILEEILLEHKRVNPQVSFSVFDGILWEKAAFQPGLGLYLNTHMFDADADNKLVRRVYAVQLPTEKLFEIEGQLFIDATGDGMLGAIVGAAHMSGRESKDVFGEVLAPDKSDHITMGNSLMFTTRDMGRPVPFIKPAWAYTFTEEQLRFRDHGEVEAGYWWIELGGVSEDIIKDGEILRDELLKSLYGVWDHIKNGGNHKADNLALDWVGALPGKRESRRLTGDYILKDTDLLGGRIFEDAVAYGGWPMDMHIDDGLKAQVIDPTVFNEVNNVYTIPYRCLYARDFDNLLLAGRNISVSHMAFGSSRDMGTTSVVGQAAGTAAAMAVAGKITPRQVGERVKELQQTLLKDDCYIPGCVADDPLDMAKTAEITASSFLPSSPPQLVVNGIARNTVEYAEDWSYADYLVTRDRSKFNVVSNGWVSQPLSEDGEWLRLAFGRVIAPREVRVTFDSNLSREIMPSISPSVIRRQTPGVPTELVKDYSIECHLQGKAVFVETVRDNYLRHRIHTIPENVVCDAIIVRVSGVNGDEHARIFEVRVY